MRRQRHIIAVDIPASSCLEIAMMTSSLDVPLRIFVQLLYVGPYRKSVIFQGRMLLQIARLLDQILEIKCDQRMTIYFF